MIILWGTDLFFYIARSQSALQAPSGEIAPTQIYYKSSTVSPKFCLSEAIQ